MIDDLLFPDPCLSGDHGLVAIGGDFRPERLLVAYASGIFPWPGPGLDYAWFSPDPRAVLVPDELHVPKRLRRILRQGRFQITYDTAFEAVIRACARSPRPGQDGTWITEPLLRGFIELHRLGFAHSAEAWRDDRLVGGVYGVSLGTMFSGESMFYLEPDASKVAFVTLVERLRDWRFRIFDCQVQTPHSVRFGAREQPRETFLAELALAVQEPSRRGSWAPASITPS